ncbi:MAG: helix-turn-helix domain-containing protein [Gemmataceae bacterium]
MADEIHYLGTREAADLLGVGESTVKRWVDNGNLPAERTLGGHRKIRVSELVRFVEARNLPRAKLERYLQPSRLAPTVGDPKNLVDSFYTALTGTDPNQATEILLAARSMGLTIAQIGDQIVMPVMGRIGHGWETGHLDIYQEHRGTQLCLTALQCLRPTLPAIAADAPLAIGGGPERDHYFLANLLIELTLRELGWKVENVGPNTPLASLAQAVRDRKPQFVWLSCSHLYDVEKFVAEYTLLYQAGRETGATLMLGGRAIDEKVRRRIPLSRFGDTLQHLVECAQELRSPRPSA